MSISIDGLRGFIYAGFSAWGGGGGGGGNSLYINKVWDWGHSNFFFELWPHYLNILKLLVGGRNPSFSPPCTYETLSYLHVHNYSLLHSLGLFS